MVLVGPHSALDVFARVIEREGNEPAATDSLRDALAEIESLAVLEPIREDATLVAMAGDKTGNWQS